MTPRAPATATVADATTSSTAGNTSVGNTAVGNTAVDQLDQLDQRFAAGDPDALRLAYDAHGSMIYTYCVRKVGSDRAPDVTQEVFVAAWRAQERFDPTKGGLAPWLMGIAKYRCVDALRQAGRRSVEQPASETLLAEPGDAATHGVVDRVADRMLLAEALDSLDERARRCLELAYYHQLTHTEVAAATGVPLGTVKSDIRRGLARLRYRLDAEEGPDTREGSAS